MTPGQRLWLEAAYRQAIEAEEKASAEKGQTDATEDAPTPEQTE